MAATMYLLHAPTISLHMQRLEQYAWGKLPTLYQDVGLNAILLL